MHHRRVTAALVTLALLTAGAGGAPGEDVEVHKPSPAAEIGGTPEFGPESSPIRPGATMRATTTADVGVAQVVEECTFNFVFYDPTTKGPPPVYIGTAGHCTAALGQRVSVGGGPTVGWVVYDSDVAQRAVDFSLIRLDANRVSQTNPKVLGWGGPSGVATTGMLRFGDQVDVHGNGVVVGEHAATRSRWGVLVGWTSQEYVADMPAVDGDSGAPLLHHPTGRALGIVSRYGVFSTPPSTDAGPLVTWIMAELSRAGFDNLVLATAS